MSLELTLFIMRVFAGLALFGFLIALYWVIWRDFKLSTQRLRSNRTIYGYLVSIAEFDGQYKQIGDKYPLLPITTLGRSATNTIIVNDNFACSEHARIILQDGQWWLEDRNSRNGTLLNEEPMRSRTILTDGDVIGIGSYSYKLELIQ